MSDPAAQQIVAARAGMALTGHVLEAAMDLALAELRRRAAALGANGVLIEQMGERRSVGVMGGYGAPLTVFQTSGQQVNGRAIYVPSQEQVQAEDPK